MSQNTQKKVKKRVIKKIKIVNVARFKEDTVNIQQIVSGNGGNPGSNCSKTIQSQIKGQQPRQQSQETSQEKEVKVADTCKSTEQFCQRFRELGPEYFPKELLRMGKGSPGKTNLNPKKFNEMIGKIEGVNCQLCNYFQERINSYKMKPESKYQGLPYLTNKQYISMAFEQAKKNKTKNDQQQERAQNEKIQSNKLKNQKPPLYSGKNLSSKSKGLLQGKDERKFYQQQPNRPVQSTQDVGTQMSYRRNSYLNSSLRNSFDRSIAPLDLESNKSSVLNSPLYDKQGSFKLRESSSLDVRSRAKDILRSLECQQLLPKIYPTPFVQNPSPQVSSRKLSFQMAPPKSRPSLPALTCHIKDNLSRGHQDSRLMWNETQDNTCSWNVQDLNQQDDDFEIATGLLNGTNDSSLLSPLLQKKKSKLMPICVEQVDPSPSFYQNLQQKDDLSNNLQDEEWHPIYMQEEQISIQDRYDSDHFSPLFKGETDFSTPEKLPNLEQKSIKESNLNISDSSQKESSRISPILSVRNKSLESPSSKRNTFPLFGQNKEVEESQSQVSDIKVKYDYDDLESTVYIDQLIARSSISSIQHLQSIVNLNNCD